MTKVIYEIVEHDGGWAYRTDGSYSETFRTHDEAHRAATRAAGEQRVAGDTDGIAYQDSRGEVHEELSPGSDRPETEVKDEI